MQDKRLDAKYITEACRKYGVKAETRASVTSTNKILKANAAELSDRYVLVASAQTDGVGRYGRKFFSPSRSGVYFSMLLKPDGAQLNIVNLTVVAAVAVCRAIEKLTENKCNIKWVNDILVGGKKVCGILAESVYDTAKNAFSAVVVGIGINTTKPRDGFDESIAHIADCIAKEGDVDVNELVAEVVCNFFALVENPDEQKLYDEYSRRLAFVGQRVDILKNGETTGDGVLAGVEKDFRLRVLTDSGVLYLDSGEISTRVAK